MANNNQNQFGGILRGIVTDNNDPLKLGRLKIRIQAAYGSQPVENLPWAWPCFGYGGTAGACSYNIPEKGAGVWVIFQDKDGQPDTTYPVWLGVWQAQNEVPPDIDGDAGDAHYYKEFRTPSGNYILFCDKPGEEFIEIKDKNEDYIRLDAKENFIEINSKNGGSLKFDSKDKSVNMHDSTGSYIKFLENGDIQIHAEHKIIFSGEIEHK